MYQNHTRNCAPNTRIYARLGSVLPTNEFKPIPISSSFSHSSLKSSVLLSDCYRHILYLLLLLFYRILTLNKRTYTHTHTSRHDALVLMPFYCTVMNARVAIYTKYCCFAQQKVWSQHLLMLSVCEWVWVAFRWCPTWESAQSILPSIANFPFDIFLWMTVARCKLNIFIWIRIVHCCVYVSCFVFN